MDRGRDNLINNIRDKAPVIAEILETPVACDNPRTGGIAGHVNRPKPPVICYMA